MMFRVGFLLCIAIGFCSVQNTPTPIEFTCDNESGKITIKLDDSTNVRSIYALGSTTTISTGQQLCSVKDPSANQTRKYEITDCVLDHPIMVFLMTVPNQNQNQGPHVDNNNKMAAAFIIGGQGFSSYSLECFKAKQIDAEHPLLHNQIDIALSATVPTDSSKTTITLSEGSVYMEMSIRQQNGNTLLPTTNIFLGDSLLIVISGPAGAAYHVKECIAYTPQKESETSTRLAYDKTTSRPELMTEFSIFSSADTNLTQLCGTRFCIKSTFYAFHFKDSNDVTFKCSLEVCKTLSGNCNSQTSFDANHSRRKRQVSDLRLYELKSTILVHDRFSKISLGTTNQGHKLRSTFYLMEIFAAVWVIITFA